MSIADSFRAYLLSLAGSKNRRYFVALAGFLLIWIAVSLLFILFYLLGIFRVGQSWQIHGLTLALTILVFALLLGIAFAAIGGFLWFLFGVLLTAPDTDTFSVAGHVSSSDRTGLGGLRVRLFDLNTLQDVLLGETQTDPTGYYSISFDKSAFVSQTKQSPDLQARVFAGNAPVGQSDVRYYSSSPVTLDVALSTDADALLPSEYEALTTAIAAYYTGALADLQESGSRHDITYLANKTGWDARAVAMAALADKFSRASGSPPIAAPFFYALFRAGLSEKGVYAIDVPSLTQVWESAISQGVISAALEGAIPETVRLFEAIAARQLLLNPAQVGPSSLKELLTISGLDDDQQQKFADLYTANRNNMGTFWEALQTALGPQVTNRLQVDGKLAFMTLNNAPLVQALHNAVGGSGVTDLLQLAEKGFYSATKWQGVLTAAVPIPQELPGDTPDAKRANYADYLASQIRLSYPTASVADMLSDPSVNVAASARAFMASHQDKFVIGMQPIEQFLAQNNLTLEAADQAQIQRVQRVFQISPSDEAMMALLRRRLDAAYHIVRYRREDFAGNFANDLGGTEAALRVYDRSVYIHNTVLNVAFTYLNANNGIAVGGQMLKPRANGKVDGGQIVQPKPNGASDYTKTTVIAYPTLEKLFGSMDFCACDECRSVLSPAAYLVDLLDFLDQSPPPAPPNQPAFRNPQDALFDRRPDIQYLPLSCENTNTAMPYIDLVNETLEYFVVHKTLSGYSGHDTGAAKSEELLANPQFVEKEAYTTLAAEIFPSPLPFHRPLENLRRYFAKFDVSLPGVMTMLRVSDSVDKNSNAYGWRDILIEESQLSRKEYEVLTSSTTTPLWQLGGFASATEDVIGGLSGVKQFARRVGVTYDDIIAILNTRFVNPSSDLVPKLMRLGVSFPTLAGVADGSIGDTEFTAMLPQGALAPDPAAYGQDGIAAWVKKTYAQLAGLIVLTDPAAVPDMDGAIESCNIDTLEFRYAVSAVGSSDPPTRLNPWDFVRMLRFIRLWKKLGWTIQQTDAAICALFRADVTPIQDSDLSDEAALDAGFTLLLPRIGILQRCLKEVDLAVQRDLLPLLGCWSPIGTHGEEALYRQMFLNPTLLAQDTAFADNGYGDFLVFASGPVPKSPTRTTLQPCVRRSICRARNTI